MGSGVVKPVSQPSVDRQVIYVKPARPPIPPPPIPPPPQPNVKIMHNLFTREEADRITKEQVNILHCIEECERQIDAYLGRQNEVRNVISFKTPFIRMARIRYIQEFCSEVFVSDKGSDVVVTEEILKWMLKKLKTLNSHIHN